MSSETIERDASELLEQRTREDEERGYIGAVPPESEPEPEPEDES